MTNSFFPQVPARSYAEDDYLTPFDAPAWTGPRWHQMPVSVGAPEELGRSDSTVILLDGFRCFTEGILLRLNIRINDAGLQARRGVFAYLDRAHGRGYLDERFKPDGLKWGIQFSDGRMASTQSESPWAGSGEIETLGGDGPVIEGTGRPQVFMDSWARDFWIWPTPPPGELLIGVEWAERGISETVTRLDASPLREAALRARPLWPSP